MNIFERILTRKRVKNTNYFDYPAATRKSLLVKAVRMANEMQLAFVEDYKKNKKHSSR